MARITNYSTAVNWLHNDYILCNNIIAIDPSVLANKRFEYYDDDGSIQEVIQWFLTSASEDEVRWLEKSFNLKFSYSEMLDLYVLCVTHYGTSWDYVPCECFNDDIPDSMLPSCR